MKRIIRLGTAFATLVASWALGMVSAMAQVEYPPTVSPQVIPRGQPPAPAPKGLAFTGLQITMWMAIVAALVAVGIALYVAGRRRAARASS